MNEKLFYDYQKVLSYNALLNFIIGERGVGKSYGAKKYVANHFLKTNKEFVYIRRYKSELKEAMLKGGEGIFFNQISADKKFKNVKFKNSKDTMYINNKVCGYAIPLSVANILKSATFENVDTIIFDEFIIDKGNYHYLQNEVIQLLDVIETIARLRDIRVLFLGNAISITNPYFTFFDLHLPYNSDIITFKDGLILVNYIKNIPYREMKKETRFGKLINDTPYGKYAIDNEFLRDSKAFIRKKTKTSKFYFILVLNNKYYGVWNDYNENTIYISKNFDPNCPTIFALNNDDHTENTMLIRARISPFFKSIIEHYRFGLLCFESQQIKNEVMRYVMKYLTY